MKTIVIDTVYVSVPSSCSCSCIRSSSCNSREKKEDPIGILGIVLLVVVVGSNLLRYYYMYSRRRCCN
jgi:hypothetical protein